LRIKRSAFTVLLLGSACVAGLPAHAQQASEVSAPEAEADGAIDFAADTLSYDTEADVITASGDVRMNREGSTLRADQVIWNRATGRVIASGKVEARNPEGDSAFGDRIELTDTLKDGVVDNILLVLARGGRIAARSGSRSAERTVLDHAVYSPCDVTDASGCPKEPLWQVKAVEVVHDPDRARIFYRNARLEILGTPILWLPRLSHPDGSQRGGTGLLVPDIRISRLNGLELSIPYYQLIGSASDLTLTPHVYSRVTPALEAEYRQLIAAGPFRIGGMITAGRPISETDATVADANRQIRGYFHANGRFQLDPAWQASFASRLSTDDTFMRRYDISRDDRLRNTAQLERIGDESYFAVAGWAVQTLRTGDSQGQQPIALPAIDYRWNPASDILGGRLAVVANSLAIMRTDGQDSRRALASVRWDMRRVLPMGQTVTITGYARGDVYQTEDILSNPIPTYRGEEGWRTRGIAAAALDVAWPFAGPAFGGTQTLTPRVQLVASPGTPNLSLPNEDSRAVDLEDSNLFALNRFPGYDRWEDGARVTWGVEWGVERPSLSFRTIVGQSYRLNDKPGLFPDGTGLTDRLSDFVGRTTLRWKSLVAVTHRFRLDKDTFAVRRNEIDAVIGSRSTYVTAGYLKLNRNIALEDLADAEEVRVGARLKFAKYWSVFGSTVLDLTSRREDTLAMADGYQPIRHRVGVAYEDECLEFGLTWRRDYIQTGDARSGNTYMLRLSFKNIGR